MNKPTPELATAAPAAPDRAGLMLGATAYALWGLLPIYFKLVRSVAPTAIVANRVLWSVFALAALLTFRRAWPQVRRGLGHRRTTLLLGLSAALIAGNWLLYVYAINSGHILAASLGYFLNPLANILLGRFVLGERLSRFQWAAVAVAAAGIVLLAAQSLGQLWISLILCCSFASYGLVRKVVAADALSGLAIETGFLAPFAVGYLAFANSPETPWLGDTTSVSLLLIATGVVSTTPLLMFTAAARRLPYSTMGMLQFLAPTIQFLLAVLVFGEPLSLVQVIAFAAIWLALALYAIGLARDARRLRSEDEAAMLAEC